MNSENNNRSMTGKNPLCLLPYEQDTITSSTKKVPRIQRTVKIPKNSNRSATTARERSNITFLNNATQQQTNVNTTNIYERTPNSNEDEEGKEDSDREDYLPQITNKKPYETGRDYVDYSDALNSMDDQQHRRHLPLRYQLASSPTKYFTSKGKEIMNSHQLSGKLPLLSTYEQFELFDKQTRFNKFQKFIKHELRQEIEEEAQEQVRYNQALLQQSVQRYPDQIYPSKVRRREEFQHFHNDHRNQNKYYDPNLEQLYSSQPNGIHHGYKPRSDRLTTSTASEVRGFVNPSTTRGLVNPSPTQSYRTNAGLPTLQSQQPQELAFTEEYKPSQVQIESLNTALNWGDGLLYWKEIRSPNLAITSRERSFDVLSDNANKWLAKFFAFPPTDTAFYTTANSQIISTMNGSTTLVIQPKDASSFSQETKNSRTSKLNGSLVWQLFAEVWAVLFETINVSDSNRVLAEEFALNSSKNENEINIFIQNMTKASDIWRLAIVISQFIEYCHRQVGNISDILFRNLDLKQYLTVFTVLSAEISPLEAFEVGTNIVPLVIKLDSQRLKRLENLITQILTSTRNSSSLPLFSSWDLSKPPTIFLNYTPTGKYTADDIKEIDLSFSRAAYYNLNDPHGVKTGTLFQDSLLFNSSYFSSVEKALASVRAEDHDLMLELLAFFLKQSVLMTDSLAQKLANNWLNIAYQTDSSRINEAMTRIHIRSVSTPTMVQICSFMFEAVSTLGLNSLYKAIWPTQQSESSDSETERYTLFAYLFFQFQSFVWSQGNYFLNEVLQAQEWCQQLKEVLLASQQKPRIDQMFSPVSWADAKSAWQRIRGGNLPIPSRYRADQVIMHDVDNFILTFYRAGDQNNDYGWLSQLVMRGDTLIKGDSLKTDAIKKLSDIDTSWKDSSFRYLIYQIWRFSFSIYLFGTDETVAESLAIHLSIISKSGFMARGSDSLRILLNGMVQTDSFWKFMSKFGVLLQEIVTYLPDISTVLYECLQPMSYWALLEVISAEFVSLEATNGQSIMFQALLALNGSKFSKLKEAIMGVADVAFDQSRFSSLGKEFFSKEQPQYADLQLLSNEKMINLRGSFPSTINNIYLPDLQMNNYVHFKQLTYSQNLYGELGQSTASKDINKLFGGNKLTSLLLPEVLTFLLRNCALSEKDARKMADQWISSNDTIDLTEINEISRQIKASTSATTTEQSLTLCKLIKVAVQTVRSLASLQKTLWPSGQVTSTDGKESLRERFFLTMNFQINTLVWSEGTCYLDQVIFDTDWQEKVFNLVKNTKAENEIGWERAIDIWSTKIRKDNLPITSRERDAVSLSIEVSTFLDYFIIYADETTKNAQKTAIVRLMVGDTRLSIASNSETFWLKEPDPWEIDKDINSDELRVKEVYAKIWSIFFQTLNMKENNLLSQLTASFCSVSIHDTKLQTLLSVIIYEQDIWKMAHAICRLLIHSHSTMADSLSASLLRYLSATSYTQLMTVLTAEFSAMLQYDCLTSILPFILCLAKKGKSYLGDLLQTIQQSLYWIKVQRGPYNKYEPVAKLPSDPLPLVFLNYLSTNQFRSVLYVLRPKAESHLPLLSWNSVKSLKGRSSDSRFKDPIQYVLFPPDISQSTREYFVKPGIEDLLISLINFFLSSCIPFENQDASLALSKYWCAMSIDSVSQGSNMELIILSETVSKQTPLAFLVS